jgi:hypothetical protein
LATYLVRGETMKRSKSPNSATIRFSCSTEFWIAYIYKKYL